MPMANPDTGRLLEDASVGIPALKGSDVKNVDVSAMIIPELCNDVSGVGASNPNEA